MQKYLYDTKKKKVSYKYFINESLWSKLKFGIHNKDVLENM